MARVGRAGARAVRTQGCGRVATNLAQKLLNYGFNRKPLFFFDLVSLIFFGILVGFTNLLAEKIETLVVS